ncbi:MAG: alpha-hydroxy-acid oxidizing protein, partial [Alphaproteobacteria bacterium]|nr:alpha-hydroxy-acid oxidizing protein [Alphaproteobacteria bacterium]
RLPRICYDFIEGGVEQEVGLQRNIDGFARHRLMPRYLVDVSTRDQSTTVFGRTYASPFGIAPTGLAGLWRHGTDLVLAAAAAKANIPFILSGSANASIEQAVKVAPQHAWYQLYPTLDRTLSADLIKRCRDCGVETLVLTVDVPVRTKRERNIRNGFTIPLGLKATTILEALRHPAWIAEYLRHGKPMLESLVPYAPADADADGVAAFSNQQLPAPQSWADVETFRRLWPGNFVIKGIMHPGDARRAAECGVDGLIVSNHGGRQLDQSPSSIEMLPAIKAAVGDRMTLMLDSGVRRGADALIALCLGARMVFTGRATLYGAVAGGADGARKAIDILRNEIDLTMGQMGCAAVAELGQVGSDFLQPAE